MSSSAGTSKSDHDGRTKPPDIDVVQSAKIVERITGNAWATDAAGRFIYVTPEALAFFGITLDELNSPTDAGIYGWRQVIHPEDYDAAAAAWHRCLQTGEHYSVEHRMLRATGSYGWARSTGQPIRDATETVVGWYGTVIDEDSRSRPGERPAENSGDPSVQNVTGAAPHSFAAIHPDDPPNVGQAQESPRESERRLQQLVETLPALIYCALPDGKPIYRSKRLRQYLGFNLEDTDNLGKSRLDGTLDAVIHPDDLATVKEHYSHSLSTGQPYALRHRLRRFDGVYRWVETRASAMCNAEGTIVQWNGICLDIQDQVHAQEELSRVQENLSRANQAASLAELSASIAHEVNQPLSAVMNYSSACQRWLTAVPPNIERAQKTLERIVQSATSAADVVSRIRALFKQSTDKRDSTELGAVVREARDLLAEQASRQRIRMDIEGESGLRLVPFDRVQIQQVLVNLMRNGLDAMASVPNEKILRIRAYRADGMVRIEVADRGRGIQFPDKIFEPFFTTKDQGMGMGLAISRSIVESHGGQLWAEKNEPRGARFVFTLPLEMTEAA